ncbi:uncharacterized protein LOC110697928 [Chenopodium quinoa]|uniref:uncharacterized protein LOC110697928 n=1 Tax=Chenopodium quinoa TaxID=63459 RepID=UPI000B7754FA|nr:uncharacterized protein LOC110697928 [Chenopodium quinoa]
MGSKNLRCAEDENRGSRGKLKESQSKFPDAVILELCNSILRELNDLHRLEESYWHAHARANEMRDGDKNTTFSTRKQKDWRLFPVVLVTFVQKVHYEDYASVKFPFISNWNSDTLNARIKVQTEDRSQFGFGIVKQDIVLSSDVLYEHSKALEAIEKNVPLALEYKNELRISSEAESTLYVQYKIPNDLPTDRKIQSMDVLDVKKKLMTLHRNMKISSSFNLSLIKELKKDAEKLSQEASQPESNFEMNDEFLEMLDSITENLIQLKKLVDKKKGFPVMVDKIKQTSTN